MAHELDQILISWFQPGAGDKLQKLCWEVRREAAFINDADRRSQVRQICHDVWGGDKAVAEYTKKFDGVKLTPEQFRVSKRDLEGAHKEIKENNPKLFESICQAIKNVREYQEEIFIGNKEENQHLGIKYTPIRRIGICVPGASAPLPSSLIMCAVPAQVAGVKEIAVVSPPRHKGSIHPIILAVCYELGIEEVYRIGGAQAVAAMAFGNGSIPKVDKIVGPGNQWVQTAKLELFGHIGIDSIAGPSEVLIIANAQANAAWVAADMLSQAEHAPGSAVVLTDSQQFAAKVLEELKKQVEKLDRSADTKQCLLKYGGIVVFDDMAKIVKWANEFAAEHLEIQCGKQSKKIADRIENAGAIFIGDYSPVAVGDYWAGPSHTLPTGGSARFFSALSANDFIKSTSIIEYDRQMLAKGAEDIIRLAEAEGLDAHARSIRIRQQSEKA